jgi:hypothetical protein
MFNRFYNSIVILEYRDNGSYFVIHSKIFTVNRISLESWNIVFNCFFQSYSHFNEGFWNFVHILSIPGWLYNDLPGPGKWIRKNTGHVSTCCPKETSFGQYTHCQPQNVFFSRENDGVLRLVASKGDQQAWWSLYPTRRLTGTQKNKRYFLQCDMQCVQ